MAVLGASPALTYLPATSQAFSGNGSQTVFTLNTSVGANTDIEVVVDNVQQSPYDSSYTVGGTTLTFSEAPATGTNNVYVVYSAARIVATTQMIPDNGSVTTSKLADASVTSSKLSGAITTPGNLSVTGTLEVLGGSGGASVTLKNGGDLRLQNALNTAAVHLYCDAAGIAIVDGKFASTNVSQNYAISSPSAGGVTVATTTPTVITSCTLTTTGKPVLLLASGDANHSAAGTWQYTQFAIDGISIGKYIVNVGSGVSYNNPFGLVHIHQPPAGTYTFQVRAWQGSGSVTWGEDGATAAPTIIAMEIL